MTFQPTTTEAYTQKPAMILSEEFYAVPGDDGTGYMLCAGTPSGEDSETSDSFDSFAELWDRWCKDRANVV